MSQLLDGRTVRPDEVGDVALLTECRLPTDGPDDPQPVWLVKTDSGTRPAWIPPGASKTGEPRPALVVEDPDAPDWTLTLTLWNRYGGPDPVETGLILDFLEPSPEDWHRLLDLLDLPNDDEVLDAYRAFPELPDGLRAELRAEDLSPRVFRYLKRVPDELEEDLIELLSIDTRVLSVQDMRHLAEALRRLDPEEYDRFRDKLGAPGEDQSPRDLGQNVLEGARTLAFPEVAERKRRYEADLQELDLDGRIDVRAPKNFEGDYLDISIRCHRGDDLDGLAEEVKKCQQLLEHV